MAYDNFIKEPFRRTRVMRSRNTTAWTSRTTSTPSARRCKACPKLTQGTPFTIISVVIGNIQYPGLSRSRSLTSWQQRGSSNTIEIQRKPRNSAATIASDVRSRSYTALHPIRGDSGTEKMSTRRTIPKSTFLWGRWRACGWHNEAGADEALTPAYKFICTMFPRTPTASPPIS